MPSTTSVSPPAVAETRFSSPPRVSSFLYRGLQECCVSLKIDHGTSGGVDVGDVDAKAKRLSIPVATSLKPKTFPSRDEVAAALLGDVKEQDKKDVRPLSLISFPTNSSITFPLGPP